MSKSYLGSIIILNSARDPLTKKLESCYPRTMTNILLCKSAASSQVKKEEVFFRRQLLKQLKLKFLLSKKTKQKTTKKPHHHEKQHHLQTQLKKTFQRKRINFQLPKHKHNFQEQGLKVFQPQTINLASFHFLSPVVPKITEFHCGHSNI